MKSLNISKLLIKLTGEHYNFDADSSNVYITCPLSQWTHKKRRDTRPSFSIKVNNLGRSACMCWSAGCNFSGTLIDLVSNLCNYNYSLDKGYLTSLVRSYENIELEDVLDGLDDYDSWQQQPNETFGEDTLRDFVELEEVLTLPWRGISEDTIITWGILYDLNENRVIFPVRNKHGELVGAIGRTTVNNSIKYKNYWNFRKSKYLYGQNIHCSDTCIIVEGPMDALIVHEAVGGSYDILALMGSIPSKHQVEYILANYSTCIIYTDNDTAGICGAHKLCEKLINKIELKLVCYKQLTKDPGGMTKKHILDHIKTAVDIIPI